MVIKDIKYWLDETDLRTPKHDEIVLWAMQNAREVIKEFIPKEGIDFDISEIKTETGHPTAGYIDLEIRAKIKFESDKNSIYYKPEYPFYYEDYTFYIEVKPKINSFGDIMRQMNFYRQSRMHDSYGEKRNIFILLTRQITPELKSAFGTQKIYVYEYKRSDDGNIREGRTT